MPSNSAALRSRRTPGSRALKALSSRRSSIPSSDSIVPMIVIYVVGYLGLSVLAGFGRGILGTKVLGAVNLGFVLIAGNYVMSWVLAVVYARVSANRHDPLVKVVVDKAQASGGAR